MYCLLATNASAPARMTRAKCRCSVLVAAREDIPAACEAPPPSKAISATTARITLPRVMSEKRRGPAKVAHVVNGARRAVSEQGYAVSRATTEAEVAMKKVLELLLCILHPIAVVLIWINLAFRGDLGLIAKLTWGIASIVPFVPFVYVLTGNDFL